MAYTPNTVIKPEKLVAQAVGMLEQELILPNLMTKVNFDDFKGAKDDTVNYKVDGFLRARNYEFRNDRSQPIVFDQYTERTFAVTLGGHAYSGIELTDEQMEFDNISDWSKTMRKQARAVSVFLSRAASAHIQSADYLVSIGGAEADLWGALLEARRVWRAFMNTETPILVVGTDFEIALLSDERFTLAKNTGDSIADTVLKTATLGQRLGFNIVVDPTITPTDAYVFSKSSFLFANAGPVVPRSIPFGATASYEGLSLRWMRDYDPRYFIERSVLDTWYGFRTVDSVLVGWDAVNQRQVASAGEHFTRGLHLKLDGTSTYNIPAEVNNATGVGTTPWTPNVPVTPAP